MAYTYTFTFSHVDTCLPCYLQDHHNRPGECLLSASVDGATTWESVLDELDSDAQSMLDQGASEAEDSDAFWRGFRQGFDALKREHESELSEPFDSSLETEDEDSDDGESCYAYFVATWTENEVVVADLSRATGLLRGYINAIVFTDQSYSDDEGHGAYWHPKALAKAEADCNAFESRFESLLEQYYEHYDSEYAGHDFWLTRNRHGAGFWDRDLPGTLGNDLKKAAQSFSECDMHLGDDGLLHMGGE